MRQLTRVVKAADGSVSLEDYHKARVSSNLSAGGAAGVNSGVELHDKAVELPTVRSIAHAAAVANLAFAPPDSPPQLPPSAFAWPPGSASPDLGPPALVRFYTLDLASAYRYICMQLLDLWCHAFIWLNFRARIGICTDTRLCFGGAYGLNRFERVTTLCSAFILRCQANFDQLHPSPPGVQRWRSHRAALQQAGHLPPGEEQLAPRSLMPYLDNFTGSGGFDPVAAPTKYPAITFDADAMRALGLKPAPSNSRVVAYATIAAGELTRLGFDVALQKMMVGSSVIALGLQPDVDQYPVICPASKRRLLLAQLADMERIVRATLELERKPIEQLTGRLSNLSQLFPELNAELNSGYRRANALARNPTAQHGGARHLIKTFRLSPSSKAGAAFLRLVRVASVALGDNFGVSLAPAAAFPPLGAPGVLSVTSDASGDIAGGDAGAVTSDASGDIAGGDAGAGGFAFHPSPPSTVYLTFEPWPRDIGAALEESAREPHERSGLPRLSMPAAELFAIWACAEAALDAGAPQDIVAIVSIGDCRPAAGALNRASSPAAQLRSLLQLACQRHRQWLGVQVRASATSTPTSSTTVAALPPSTPQPQPPASQSSARPFQHAAGQSCAPSSQTRAQTR